MTFTLAITHYNRAILLMQSFSQVLSDPRIDEILILDDCSDEQNWNLVKLLEQSKVRVIRQAENRGMAQNKRDAIAYAKNEWVIILDSDNIISPAYLDAIPKRLKSNTIYCPEFAEPNFDYRSCSGLTFSAHYKPNLNSATESCCFNTCNYLVHRDSYIEVWEANPEVRGVDTLWFAYLWMKAGNMFYIVPKMRYFHLVHDGSEYMKHVSYNMQHAKQIQKLIEKL